MPKGTGRRGGGAEGNRGAAHNSNPQWVNSRAKSVVSHSEVKGQSLYSEGTVLTFTGPSRVLRDYGFVPHHQRRRAPP